MADIPEGQFYIASNMATGKVLTIEGKSTTSGAKLVLEPKNTTDKAHQLWTFNVDQKTFQSNLTPSFVITIDGGTLASGNPIVNETYTAGRPYQQWTAPFDGTIQSVKHNGYVIGLKDQSAATGTPAVLTTRTSQPEPHCMWHFENF